MAIRQLPVVGRPTSPPARPRKIALEEHVIDPGLVTPTWDSFSGELGEQGPAPPASTPSTPTRSTRGCTTCTRAGSRRRRRIDVAILSHTIGGVEGVSDPAGVVSTARRASDYPDDMAADAARGIETAPSSENDHRKICYGHAAALVR